MILSNKAMQKGPNGLIWAIIQSAFAFPFLMGILFFQVPCSIVRGVGLVMLLAAMILMGLLGKGNEMNGKRNYIWVFYAVLGFLCAGATQCCANIPSYLIQEESDGVWTILSRIGISASGTVAVIVLHGLFDRKVFNGKGCKIGTIVMTAASILSLLFTFLALDCFAAVNAGAIAYPMIVGISIAVFMVYTAIKLKERLSLPVLLSVLLCLSGIVVITL